MLPNVFRISETGDLGTFRGNVPVTLQQADAARQLGVNGNTPWQDMLSRYGHDYNSIPSVSVEQLVKRLDPYAHPNYFFEKAQRADSVSDLLGGSPPPPSPPSPTVPSMPSTMQTFTLPSGLIYQAPQLSNLLGSADRTNQLLGTNQFQNQPNQSSPIDYSSIPITSSFFESRTPPQITAPHTVPLYPVSSLNNVPELTKPEQQASDLSKRLEELTGQLTGQSSYRYQQETAEGIPQLRQTQKDLISQLSSLKAEEVALHNRVGDINSQALAGLNAVRGETIPMDIIGARSQNIRENANAMVQSIEQGALRTNAIQALSVAAQLEASRGNIATALDLVDRAVNQKYDPIKEQIAALQSNLQLVQKSPEYTLAEKNRAYAQELLLRQQEMSIQYAKQNMTDIWNVTMSAAQNLPSFRPTPQYPTSASALQAIQNSSTKENALAIASQTGLIKQPVALSDYEQAFLREKGRLPTIAELDAHKTVQTNPKAENRDASVSQFLESKKGNDGLISAQMYQEGLRRFIAGGGTQANFVASFPQQTYLKQQEIDNLPAGLRTVQVAPQKTLSAEQQSILNEAKATWDAAKQTYQATPELRQKILDRAKQYGFDLAPYF